MSKIEVNNFCNINKITNKLGLFHLYGYFQQKDYVFSFGKRKRVKINDFHPFELIFLEKNYSSTSSK